MGTFPVLFAAIEYTNVITAMIAAVGGVVAAGVPGFFAYLKERRIAAEERLKAEAEREKAEAEREKAEAERRRADSERDRALAEQERAQAERDIARLEREKVDSMELAVGRLEGERSNMENSVIVLQETIDDLKSIVRKFVDGGSLADDKLLPARVVINDLPVLGQSDVESVTLPFQAASFVIWAKQPIVESPRFVHLSWEVTPDRAAFRIRDFIGGRLLHQPGVKPNHEPNLAPAESSLDLEHIWASASCHKPCRGELDHTISDFVWWRGRLEQMTYNANSEQIRKISAITRLGRKNVLLMLSSAQQPPPRQEVRWHATQRLEDDTTSCLATTRVLTNLTPEESIVAFYGDVTLANQLLGYGVFVEYIRAETSKGQKILEAHPHYSVHGLPKRVLGIIRMREFQELPDGTCIDRLNGIIDSDGQSNGLPLTWPNLPQGASKAQIYYRKADGK